MYNDRNTYWKTKSNPIRLSEFDSKVQFLRNYFLMNGDSGYFAESEFTNYLPYIFELIDSGLEQQAISELNSTLSALDIGISLDSTSSITAENDSYVFNLVCIIDGEKVPFNRSYTK